MDHLEHYFPRRINDGRLATAYTLNELEQRIEHERVVLPICSLGTPAEQVLQTGPLVLPPLYHEALDPELKDELIQRIRECFPYYLGTSKRTTESTRFEIVELPPIKHTPVQKPRVLAFSVDTAVEEHGPHLPLMTDTIQSYGVLNRLAAEIDEMVIGPPVEYGQLTWGLPFGLSIDLTAPLLTRYVTGFVNAVLDWIAPETIYVVDVHGSMVHRTAIQDGLRDSRCEDWAFRWLHEPLVEFAGQRGDQHAGGVETALVHLINHQLLDSRWWPQRVDDLAARQMSLEEAVELSADLSRFIERVEKGAMNGIVGDVRNFFNVDAELMMNRMLDISRSDVQSLLSRGC